VESSQTFPENAIRAIADDQLRDALNKVRDGFGGARRQIAVDRLPEFDALRDAARDIKNHVITHLDLISSGSNNASRKAVAWFIGVRHRMRRVIWCLASARRSTRGRSPRERP